MRCPNLPLARPPGNAARFSIAEIRPRALRRLVELSRLQRPAPPPGREAQHARHHEQARTGLRDGTERIDV